MNIIKPSYKIITKDYNNLEAIEIAARTCYKSEHKIDEGSAEELIKKLLRRGHMAMLEFGDTPILGINEIQAQVLVELNIKMQSDVNGMNNGTKYFEITETPQRRLISGNLRAYMELVESYASEYKIVDLIGQTLAKVYPLLFVNKIGYERTLRIYSLRDLNKFELFHHKYETVKFIVNRGVSHELVRHRVCAFAQESTRYCNYGKSEHVSFIIPYWSKELNKLEGEVNILADSVDHLIDKDWNWLDHIDNCEKAYSYQIDAGMAPQDARDLLPIAVKTEINIKANLKEWAVIFKQRTPKSAHPQMREVMQPLLDEFKVLNPEQFDNITY